MSPARNGLALLLGVYQSFWSAALLLISLAAGIGPNYGIMCLSYDEINPVVMGATGVLLGLGTEYGEHLWGRLREEIDKGSPPQSAIFTAYEQTGPPVVLGAPQKFRHQVLKYGLHRLSCSRHPQPGEEIMSLAVFSFRYEEETGG
jgi:hypothetical protein